MDKCSWKKVELIFWFQNCSSHPSSISIMNVANSGLRVILSIPAANSGGYKIRNFLFPYALDIQNVEKHNWVLPKLVVLLNLIEKLIYKLIYQLIY